MTQSALTRVPGFLAVGVTCGLKASGNPDLTLILSDSLCSGAALFTTNVFKAAPVLYDMALLERTGGKLQGVVINAGNANAVTGRQGLGDAEQMARLAEQAAGLPPDTMFVMSTGVIGKKMPMDTVAKGIQLAANQIKTDAGRQGLNAARAILTTDLVPKEAFLQANIGGQTVSIGGMAKGSGMIHPNMATMLSVLVTDAVIEPDVLKSALVRAADLSFHCVTVDGDTSTNDTVLVLASGQAGNPPITAGSAGFDAFTDALTEACVKLAKAIAKDGEGATKLIEITVTGAANPSEAKSAAETVATSPLTKTAFFGNDPNWGRALAAIGRSGVTVNPARISLHLGPFHLVDNGEPLAFNAEAAAQWLTDAHEVKLVADLAVGQACATVWTCDLSYKYVEINAEYHT